MVRRPQLERALGVLEAGDVLMVTKPDRLARSTSHLLAIVEDLNRRGVGLVVLSMGGERLDTRNPTSKLILTVMAGIATWEREIMLERQRGPLDAAMAEGRCRGAKPTKPDLIESILDWDYEGMKSENIALKVGRSKRHVDRIIKRYKVLPDNNIRSYKAMVKPRRPRPLPGVTLNTVLTQDESFR
jgi:DNA invertase Pin-like site-specific DNA recombinase